jgi:ribosome biogenesis ATPase
MFEKAIVCLLFLLKFFANFKVYLIFKFNIKFIKASAPCILFIDEIEAITQRRETATKNMEHRIVTQLLSCFDDLAVKSYVPIVVIGATNQADSLDIGLRRAGRFDQEIAIGIPDDKHRKKFE